MAQEALDNKIIPFPSKEEPYIPIEYEPEGTQEQYVEMVQAISTAADRLLSIRERNIREIIKTEIKAALRPIQMEINTIKQQLNELSELVGLESEPIILRDISHTKAKSEIENLFNNTSDILYFSDIVEQLAIDLELVVSVCNELLEEGKIEYTDEGPRKNPSRR
jgi:hypothetical protein